MPLSLFGGLRPVEPQACASRSARGREPVIDKHSAGLGLFTHRRHTRGRRTLHLAAAADRIRDIRLVAPPRRGGRLGDGRDLSPARCPASPCRRAIDTWGWSVLVALLTAALLLVARIFKLGFLADFLSRTVLTGISRRCRAPGRHRDAERHVRRRSPFTLFAGSRLANHGGLPHLHYPTLALSTLVAGSILLGNRFAPRLPLALIAVVASIVASAAFDFTERGIALVGPIAGGLPSIRSPR